MSPSTAGMRHYCLIVPMHGVRLTSPGSDHGSIATIPSGSILQIQGSSALNHMVEVKWRDGLYALFEEDLIRRAQPLSALSRSA